MFAKRVAGFLVWLVAASAAFASEPVPMDDPVYCDGKSYVWNVHQWGETGAIVRTDSNLCRDVLRQAAAMMNETEGVIDAYPYGYLPLLYAPNAETFEPCSADPVVEGTEIQLAMWMRLEDYEFMGVNFPVVSSVCGPDTITASVLSRGSEGSQVLIVMAAVMCAGLGFIGGQQR